MESLKKHLLRYTRYNLWANEALAAVLKDMDPSWADKEIVSSFPSIRKTVFHILDAETIWLARFKGVSLSAFPSRDFSAGTPIDSFTEKSREFAAFVSDCDEAFFSGSTAFKDLKGNPHTMDNAGMLMHCMNHSSFHRGQLVTMLRQCGFSGEMPRTDFVIYLREEGNRIL